MASPAEGLSGRGRHPYQLYLCGRIEKPDNPDEGHRRVPLPKYLPVGRSQLREGRPVCGQIGDEDLERDQILSAGPDAEETGLHIATRLGELLD